MGGGGGEGFLGSRDLGKWAENFTILTLQPGHRDNSGMNSGGSDGVVLHCLLCFPHKKHPSAAIQL